MSERRFRKAGRSKKIIEMLINVTLTPIIRGDPNYSREKWGSYQADIYLAQIENRILGLLEMPYLVTARSDVCLMDTGVCRKVSILFFIVWIMMLYIFLVFHMPGKKQDLTPHDISKPHSHYCKYMLYLYVFLYKRR